LPGLPVVTPEGVVRGAGSPDAIAGKFLAENEYVFGAGAEEALRSILAGARRGEGFGNARFARTIFEQALNTQALRLARVEGSVLENLSQTDLITLESDDVISAARGLGEEPAGTAEARGFWRRRSSRG